MIRFLLTSAALLRTDGVLLMALAVTLAVSAPFLARHPLVMRYAKRREEKRILRAPLPPEPPCPRVEDRETCRMSAAEEEAFAEVAGELREQGYQWLVDAINMEAGQ